MTAPESTTSQRIIRGRERELKALEMRKAGATFEQIGNALGITPQGAHRAVKRALRRIIEKSDEAAEEIRRLELERLDAMLLALWPQAKRGNLGAVDRILRIMERRAKLLGLDAPKAVDITTDGGPIVIRWPSEADEEASH